MTRERRKLRHLKNHGLFSQMSKADLKMADREGWKIVGPTRLSLRDYFFASWIGMIPGTVMYVYLGSLAGSLAALGAGQSTRTPAFITNGRERQQRFAAVLTGGAP